MGQQNWFMVGLGRPRGPGRADRAGGHQVGTGLGSRLGARGPVEAGADVVREFAGPVHRIPASVLRDTTGVAIVPRMVKAGILFDARFGHGVVVLHRPDGSWSNPVFVKLEGFGIGGEAGFESTDVVLIFKTRTGLDHLLQGREKLTLGADATIAAGPIGREAEVSVRGRKTEVFSYTRNRGLFAGVSVAGAGV